MRNQEKETVLRAIDQLGRRVTVADVATKTGMPLSLVTANLNQIASETGGHLEVATTGDVAYRFAPGYRTAYLAHGFQQIAGQVLSQILRAGYFLLKISFGITLIVSFGIVSVLFFAILLRAGGNRRDDDSFDIDLTFLWIALREMLFWGYYTSTSPYDYRRNRPSSKGNFLLNCFSFLFGDGNPNATIDEEKWQLLAGKIRQQGGILTVEQAAPYTGSSPRNEDGMLPVLVRFNGLPEVTDRGSIIYRFPSLQVSAQKDHDSAVKEMLRERPWKFSQVSNDGLIPVIALAALNFLGSWWLIMSMSHSPLLASLAPLLYFLVAYGTLFVLIPLLRWLLYQGRNRGIAARNADRQAYAELLKNPAPELQDKLLEAREFAMKRQTLTEDKIVYTTDKDALEQEFEV